ncbi:MAG: hypothetical protein KY475_15615 [Planctomycetes bacterium]|nr:hypothetical protein [Planctomycetota bacterium]
MRPTHPHVSIDHADLAASPGALPPPRAAMPIVAAEVLGPEQINVGGVASYTVVVSNLGETAVEGVLAKVTVPADAKLQQIDPLPLSREKDQLRFEIGRLAPKSRKRIQVELAARTRGEFQIHAEVVFSASAQFETRICEPELAVVVAGPETVVVGDAATFKVIITNRGDGAAENVAVSQRLAGDPQGMVGAAHLGRLAPGESRELHLSAMAAAPGRLRTQFLATAWGGIEVAAEAEVHVAQPMLSLEAFGPRVCAVQAVEVFTVTLANPGDAPASNIEAVIALPPGLEVLAFDRPVQFDAARRLIRWRLPSLAPSGRDSLRVQAAAAHADRFLLQVAAAADHGLRVETTHLTEAAAVHRRAA